MSKTVITLEDDQAYADVRCYRGSTALPPKKMLLREVYNIISLDPKKISVEKEVRYTTAASPILGQTGVVKYIQYLRDDRLHSETVMIALPKGRYDTKYYHKRFREVGYPRLLFIFKIRQINKEGKKVPENTQIYALKEGRIRDDTPLYHYPFSNANPVACWGDYGIGKVEVEDVYELRGLPYAFLQLEKNNDLFEPKNNGLGAAHKDLLRICANNDFDEGILVPCNKKIEDLR